MHARLRTRKLLASDPKPLALQDFDNTVWAGLAVMRHCTAQQLHGDGDSLFESLETFGRAQIRRRLPSVSQCATGSAQVPEDRASRRGVSQDVQAPRPAGPRLREACS